MKMFNRIIHKDDHGFTLVELLVVFIIIGITAALAAPNFIGMLNRFYVTEAIDKLNGAIKETQRLAMRQGKLCKININPTTKIISGTPNGCLLKDRQLRKEIKIRTNLSGSLPYINFSHKGSTTRMGTIVISSRLSDVQECFVISLGIGITRTGSYVGSKSGSISSSKCRPNNYK